jgi:fumarylacetoacetate (FAA) hydrolase
MKLATLRDRSRDGRLVVVSRDLTLCSDARHLAPTLQAALDGWDAIAAELALIARGLETGGQPTQRFHERDALAVLPRAYNRLDPGRRHGARTFAAPRASLPPGPVSAGLAVLTGDLVQGADPEAARRAIRLVVLICEAAGGATLAPAAIIPDAFLEGALTLDVGATRLTCEGPFPDLGDLVALAARDRALAAGCVVAAPALIADAPLASGSTLRVEMRDAAGHSMFGAIEGGAA